MAITGLLPASAQTPSLVVNITSLTAEDDDSAQAIVTVVDGSGQPVVDLPQEAFAVQLNDEPVVVSALDRGIDSSQPISVLLALDVSGSMEGTALDEAKAAAVGFLESLEPDDSVGILTFADQVSQVLPFTTDRAAATQTIESLVASGAAGTALYQATETSLRLASEEGTSYRAVILLSDGVDNGSVLTRDDVLSTAGTLGVPLFAIGLGNAIDRDYLDSIASLTGGGFAETPSPEGLAQLYAAAGERLRGQYIVTLDTTDTSFVPTAPAQLRVEVTSGDQTGSVAREVCARRLCAAIEEIAPNEEIESARTVTANVISADPILSVAFLVDGEQVAEFAEPPYEYTFDPAAFETGARTLSLEVETSTGESISTEFAVSIPGSSGGGMSMTTIFMGGIVVLLLVAVLFWFFRRRSGQRFRPNNPDDLVPPARDEELALSGPRPKIWPEQPSPPLPPRIEAMGRLYVEGGAMTGKSFPVGGSPIRVGSNESCEIRLSYEAGDEEQIAGEYLRVWVRDELLMLHEVRKMTVTGSIGGRWAKIGPGDSIPIGPYTLRFELGAEEDPELAKPVPNVLRDPAVVNEERDQLVSVKEAAGEDSPSLNHFASPEATAANGTIAEPEQATANGVMVDPEDQPASGASATLEEVPSHDNVEE